MKTRLLTLLLLLALPLCARAEDRSEARYSVGFGAGPQSGNGVHVGFLRGANAVDVGLGLIYDSQNAEWGYSTGVRYLRTLYAGSINDTYAWGGGAITGNYRDQTASHITSFGAGLGIAFHGGLPVQFYFDSGLATYLSKGLEKQEFYPAFNGGIRYVW